MKLSSGFTLFSALSSAFAAVPIPKESSIAAITVPDQSGIRIYHQHDVSSGIWEVDTRLPTTGGLADIRIYNGTTRANTPLAAVSWADGKGTQIRVYFITSSNTLGEVAYTGTGWNTAGNIGFTVQAGSEALYATKANNYLLVGYTNADGNLAEAYYVIGGTGVWQTYNL